MRFREYLKRRVAHMIIVILLFLVIQFALFRVMPGDPAASVTEVPGMPPEQVKQLRVEYGFSEWQMTPGDGFTSEFRVPYKGEYYFFINATHESNTDSVEGIFYVDVPENEDHFAPLIQSIDYSINATNTVNITVNATDDHEALHTDVKRVTGFYDENGEKRTIQFEKNSTSGIFTGIFDADETKDYSLNITAMDYGGATSQCAISIPVGTTSSTEKITNVQVIKSSSGYPEIGDTITLSAFVEGETTTPRFIVKTLNSEDYIIPTEESAGFFNASYNLDTSGSFEFDVAAENTYAVLPFYVNCGENEVTLVQGDSSPGRAPHMSGLVVQNETGGYPLTDGDVTLWINISSVADKEIPVDGLVTLNVTYPNGTTFEQYIYHPQDIIDTPIYKQFFDYIVDMLTFNFGYSFKYKGQDVIELLSERMPSTALLFGTALVVSYAIGMVLGMLVAWKRDTHFEMATIVSTLFFRSMPLFWFGLLMQWVFFAQLGWLPLSGLGGFDPVSGEQYVGMKYVVDVLTHMILPLMTLTISHLSGTILLMRTSLLEVLGEDYIMTAKAKGLSDRRVMIRHAARNALLPVVTSMVLSISSVISGGILTETIFSWPGTGLLLVEATLSKDLPVVQGVFFMFALMTIVGNFTADLLYAYLDPRVRL